MSTVAGGNDVKSQCGKFTCSDQSKGYFKHDFALDFINDIKDKKSKF